MGMRGLVSSGSWWRPVGVSFEVDYEFHYDSTRRFHSVRNTRHTHTHTQTDCNEVRPQTAQFYNERISTEPVLVTWQSTVYEPPEDGLKKRPKHVGASVKCFEPFKTRIKSHLLFAGIIRSSPFSPR